MSLFHALHIWGFTGLFVFLFGCCCFFFSAFPFPKVILNYMKKYSKLRPHQFIKCWQHSVLIKKTKPKSKDTPLKTNKNPPKTPKQQQNHLNPQLPKNTPQKINQPSTNIREGHGKKSIISKVGPCSSCIWSHNLLKHTIQVSI